MDVNTCTTFGAVVISLLALWQGGDYVIKYSLEIASLYRVSTFFVGFVMLALAANLPELTVAVFSALKGASAVSAGDIVGANFSDIALVVGFTLLLSRSINIRRAESKGILRLVIAAAVVMGIVFWIGCLRWWHGIILISTYAIFLTWAWKHRHDQVVLDTFEIPQGERKECSLQEKIWLCIKWLFAWGLVLAGSGGAVHYAVKLATFLSLPLETVGATLVAVGTSLPEISISLNAFRRGHYALALGPTIGTVLSQATLILGILTVLSDAPVNLTPLRVPALFMFVAFFVIAIAIIKDRMGRMTGVALISLFIIYLLYHAFPGMIV